MLKSLIQNFKFLFLFEHLQLITNQNLLIKLICNINTLGYNANLNKYYSGYSISTKYAILQ